MALNVNRRVSNNARAVITPPPDEELTDALWQSSLETLELKDILLLPKVLPRPAPCEIPKEAITAIDAGLAGPPIEYLRHKLLGDMSKKAYETAAYALPTYSLNEVPDALEIVTLDGSASIPSHFFAVYSHPHQTTPVTIYPVHDLIFAVQCPHLPRFTRFQEDTSNDEIYKLALPVIRLYLPSEDTFRLLFRYIYLHDHLGLKKALLPVHKGRNIVRGLAAAYAVSTLVSFLEKIRGFWTNVYTLGIFDDEKLWETIDYAWKTLLDALAIVPAAVCYNLPLTKA